MTPREAVFATIRHQETGHVPYNLSFSPPAEAALKAHYGVDDLQERLRLHLSLFGCAGKPLYASPEEYGPTITDPFGVVWTTSRIDRGCPVGRPLKQAALDGYTFPEPHAPERWEGVAEASRRYPWAFRLAVVGDLWEQAHFLRGLEPLLCDLVEHPSFVHALMERIYDYNAQTLERLAGLAADGVFISDDYGFQDRLMMRPAQWREFVRPYLAALLGEARRRGLVTMLHSCGNVTEILPDLVEIGLDILHPVQPEAMDIFTLKREFGRDLTFCGGISTQRLLPFASPEEVRWEVRRTIEVMSAGGGYIAEPGITLQADVPLENLVALVETAREYGGNP